MTTCSWTCGSLPNSDACVAQTGCAWTNGTAGQICQSLDENISGGVWAGVAFSLSGNVLIKWIGITLLASGELGNVVAYGFAPAAIVTPLGAVGVIVNIFITTIWLKEVMTLINLVGILTVIGGIVVIVVFAPRSVIDIQSATVFQTYIVTPEMGIYMAIFAVGFVLMLPMCKRFGDRTVVIYVSTGAIVASLTIVSAKIFSSLVTQSVNNGTPNDWLSAVPYVTLIILASTAVGSMRFINTAMMKFGNSQVVPVYYAMFTAASVGSEGFVFREFNCFESPKSAGVFGAGIILAAAGVYMAQRKALQPAQDMPQGTMDGSRTKQPSQGGYPKSPMQAGGKGMGGHTVGGAGSNCADEDLGTGQRSTLGALRSNLQYPLKTLLEEKELQPVSNQLRMSLLKRGSWRSTSSESGHAADRETQCFVIEQLLCQQCNQVALGRTPSGEVVDLDDPLRRVIVGGKNGPSDMVLEVAKECCPECRLKSLHHSSSILSRSDTYHGFKWFRSDVGVPLNYPLNRAPSCNSSEGDLTNLSYQPSSTYPDCAEGSTLDDVHNNNNLNDGETYPSGQGSPHGMHINTFRSGARPKGRGGGVQGRGHVSVMEVRDSVVAPPLSAAQEIQELNEMLAGIWVEHQEEREAGEMWMREVGEAEDEEEEHADVTCNVHWGGDVAMGRAGGGDMMHTGAEERARQLRSFLSMTEGLSVGDLTGLERTTSQVGSWDMARNMHMWGPRPMCDVRRSATSGSSDSAARVSRVSSSHTSAAAEMNLLRMGIV